MLRPSRCSSSTSSPPIEQRPALCVLRFVIHDAAGTAGRGVRRGGAASAEAHMARAEADRLVTLDRVARMGAAEARAQLLAQWGLSSPEARTIAPSLAASLAGVPIALAGQDEALGRQLADEQARVKSLQEALADAQTQPGVARG